MEGLRHYRPTTLSERSRFVWLWQCGLSARAIAQECGTSVTTVCRWLRRWRTEGHFYTRHRSGRPRKSDTERLKTLRNGTQGFNTLRNNTQSLNTLQNNTPGLNTLRNETQGMNTLQNNTPGLNTLWNDTLQNKTQGYNTIQNNTPGLNTLRNETQGINTIQNAPGLNTLRNDTLQNETQGFNMLQNNNPELNMLRNDTQDLKKLQKGACDGPQVEGIQSKASRNSSVNEQISITSSGAGEDDTNTMHPVEGLQQIEVQPPVSQNLSINAVSNIYSSAMHKYDANTMHQVNRMQSPVAKTSSACPNISKELLMNDHRTPKQLYNEVNRMPQLQSLDSKPSSVIASTPNRPQKNDCPNLHDGMNRMPQGTQHQVSKNATVDSPISNRPLIICEANGDKMHQLVAMHSSGCKDVSVDYPSSNNSSISQKDIAQASSCSQNRKYQNSVSEISTPVFNNSSGNVPLTNHSSINVLDSKYPSSITEANSGVSVNNRYPAQAPEKYYQSLDPYGSGSNNFPHMKYTYSPPGKGTESCQLYAEDGLDRRYPGFSSNQWGTSNANYIFFEHNWRYMPTYYKFHDNIYN